VNKPKLIKAWDENEAHRDQWLPLILDYQEGSLEGPEQNQLKQHLAECNACTADLDGMRQTVTLLHRLPEIPAPRSFTLSPFQARRLTPSPVYRFSQFAAAIAAAFLIFAFALDLAGTFTPPAPPTPVAVVTADPTATLEPVGTLAASTAKAGSGSNSALGGVPVTVPATKAANPTAIPPVASKTNPASIGGSNPDIRLIEAALLVATLLFIAFAVVSRPRAPGRMKI
jgi:anti-sigma factor RsiW